MITEVNQVLERVAPTQKQREESVKFLEKKIIHDLAKNAEAHQQRAQSVLGLVEPFQKTNGIDKDRIDVSFRSLKDLALGEHASQRVNLRDQITDIEARQKFMLEIDGHLRIMGPPYDVEWIHGAVGYADKTIGEFGIAPMNGYAASALGVYLSPTDNMIARFTTYMPVTYSWFNWIINSGYAGTYGGIGVMIYDLQEGKILADNRAQLWNAVSTNPGLSNSPETLIYLGDTTARETYFPMKAGGTYLVWTWCWSSAVFAGNIALSMSSIACKMPFLVIKPWLSI